MLDESILNSIKKTLNLGETDTSFDQDVIMHINTVFANLNLLGIGPENGFQITDSSATWNTFVDDKRFNAMQSYMSMRVRLIFDPPLPSVITSMEAQIEKLEWQLNVVREGDAWTDPNSPTTV